MKSTYAWLNYHHLLYFWTAVEEGGVVGAAEALRVSHPTVSTQIKQLEESLETPLFDRQGRRLVLTAEGRVVHTYATEIFRTGQALIRRAQAGFAAEAEPLRVGVSPAVPKHRVRALLRPVLGQLPDAEMSVDMEGTDPLFERLHRRTVDVVVTDEPVPSGLATSLVSHRLPSVAASFLGHPEFSLEGDALPACLEDAPLLLPPPHTQVRRQIDDWLLRNGVEPGRVLSVADTSLMKLLAGDGQGILAVPADLAAEICHEYGLVEVGVIDDIRFAVYLTTLLAGVRHAAVDVLLRAHGAGP